MENIELGQTEEISTSGEGGKEVSQEDLIRVSEQIRKGNKYSGQIRTTSMQNNKYAKFIQYLIINIADDVFWEKATVFDSKNTEGIPLGENNAILVHLFCGFMAAVFPEQADEYGLRDLYVDLDYHIPKTFLDYLNYIQQLGKNSENTRKLNQEGLNDFVKYVLVHFGFEDNQKLENNDIKSLG